MLSVEPDGGLTSPGVVARGRKRLRTNKVGHAGPLDPRAPGGLVLGVDRATKLLGLLTRPTKADTATIRLGQATTTDDAEGEIVSTPPAGAVT
ncbi:tRNA pseudouridine(55) synthase TruB, partial [Nocardia cyriacigeorgica]|nr:tRNA pseudouridine(55) synthase TruB [Nocardia cyriacigeorgica]